MSNTVKLYFKNMNDSLEKNGYFYYDNLFSKCDIQSLLNIGIRKNKEGLLEQSLIGRGEQKMIDQSVRKTKINWITNWRESTVLDNFRMVLLETLSYLNQSYLLSMKRIESQFAYYEVGGFYKKHLDQLKKTKHRQVTCILYLNNVDIGGELILYQRDNPNIIGEILKPKAGRLVLFFSGQIFHEVRPVHSCRYSITTWMRDDEIMPFY